MGKVKAYYTAQPIQHDSTDSAEQSERKMFLLLCNGKPLALYDHRDTAEYEMHICIQGDMHEGQENRYRIKTMGVVTHAIEEDRV